MCRHFLKRRAFTLIEMLVCVLIIVILIALLVPVIGKAKDTAKSGACMANTHTLAIAAINFAASHNGYFQPVSNDDNVGHTQTSWITAADPLHSRWSYSSDPNRHANDFMSAIIPYMGGLVTDNINNMQSTTNYTTYSGSGVTDTTTGLSTWVDMRTKSRHCPENHHHRHYPAARRSFARS